MSHKSESQLSIKRNKVHTYGNIFFWNNSFVSVYGNLRMPEEPETAREALFFLRLESCANTNMSQILKILQFN